MDEYLNSILKEAIFIGITDLHFKSQYDSQIYMRLNNQIKVFKKLNFDIYQRLLVYLKYKSHLDFNQMTQPQTGSFQLNIENAIYYFRLSYLPSNNDIHLVLRILNHKNKITFANLTNNKEELDYLTHILDKENGLIVVCGPTGSGKSTTLHCFLDKLIAGNNKNILTIEDPIEIYHKEIIQIQVNQQTGMSFEKVLEQVLRHDPDIIMIGELRNEKTAKIALNLALTGHLVMTTLHASDGISAIRRLNKLQISNDDISQVIISIITQRLFYKKDTYDPFVVFELWDRDSLNLYLNNQPYKYVSLKSKIYHYYKEGWISENDYQKYT